MAKQRGRQRLRIRGEEHDICWPPDNAREWEVLRQYFDLQDEIMHNMRRAIVSLEKKVHWGMPSAPALKKRCPFACVDKEGEPVDPVDPDDEGDGSGAGSDERQDVEWM